MNEGHVEIGTGRVPNIQQGFTLVELTVVMVLVGIIAIALLPRFANVDSFGNRGFYDRLKTAVEFARKTAVAQRRNVCVSFGGPAITITRATAAGAAAACNVAVTDPATGAAYSLLAPAGVNVATTLGVIVFGSMGSASGDATITVSLAGDVARTFTVHAATGHVSTP